MKCSLDTSNFLKEIVSICLLLGRKVMTNLDSMLKSRDITLSTKVCLVKEIQPVHPKGDQSWVFIGGTDVEAENPIFWPPDAES